MTEDQQPTLPLLAKPRLKTELVENQDGLERLIKSLASNTRPIALDAERASGFRYGQKAYLLQIAIHRDAIYLFDPVSDYSLDSLSNLRELLNKTPWIIHAASQDIPCLAEMGIQPSIIFDTELAGRILGLPKVSLGTLTEYFLGFSLAKEHSAADWSARPIPEEWLNYAALDVDVLFELWEKVSAALVEKGKLEIALEEFQHLTIAKEREPKRDRWRSTTGIHEIKDQRQLTMIKLLWEARENLAKEKDIAPGRLIPDGAIIAAVKANPQSRSELASLRSFTGRASRTYIDQWWLAIQKGQTTDDLVELRPKNTGLPNHRNWPSKFPEAHARLLWAKQLLSQKAQELEIPLENLVSPDTVKNLCFTPPLLEEKTIREELNRLGVRKWQQDQILRPLLVALGKTEIPPPIEPSD